MVNEMRAVKKEGGKALVIGLGASGLASIDYLLERGWQVAAADTREAPAGAARVRAAHPEVALALGAVPVDLAEGIDLVVMSPGLSPCFSEAAPLVAAARERGIDVAGEIELFARELRLLKDESGYAPIVIGITGTNGKTTTTALTAKMAEAAGLKTKAAGNIGPNAVAELLKSEREGVLPDCWVLELSSFQLETTSSLVCRSAAILNVAEDHIDWHGSLDAYAEAKARIFAPESVAVVNREDERTLAAASDKTAGMVRTFGSDAPKAAGEYGLIDIDGAAWLACVNRKAGGVLETVRLMPESALKIRGRHNSMNALAAVALATSAGIPLESALEALAVYAGEPHRVSYVMTVDGVDFIDDSKGTNVGAVAAAVSGFGTQKRRVLILLGGDGKGQDFSPLKEALAGTAGAAALIGRDAEKIGAALEGSGVPMKRAATLEEAVDWLWSQRRPGDVLLLSPACASWDMFKDYAERSARFVAHAEKIAAGLDGGAG